MQLYAAFFPCPLGLLTIQCTDHHVRSVLFSVEENREVAEQQHPLLLDCTRQLQEYFEGKRTSFDLPLLQEGTDFQNRVWTLLLSIPFGRTISYQELSRQYGDPKAIRAVASANGKNNLAIMVPCHRVIGSNRSLTGYAGGLWRKKWLLDHEARYHHGVQELFG